MSNGSSQVLHNAAVSRVSAGAILTYEPFYGLREKPFSLSADPRFLYRSPAHGLAFDELQAGIRRREGLIVLTGEIGTGKTTLCRSVLQHLDQRTFAAFVADPFVSREDLLKMLLVDFGVISVGDLTRGRFNGASRSDLSYPLYEFLDSLAPLQAFAVLVIDEAQNLSPPLLEEIRILSELELREKLLQVVLVGQPELRTSLKLPEMRQVNQRVSVRCELTALDAAGVRGYVNHRLTIAGRGESRVEFTESGLERICDGSAGVPRLINRICDRALQRAFTARSLKVDAEFVRAAIDDLGLTASTRKQIQTPLEPVTNASGPAASADVPALPEPPPIIPTLVDTDAPGLVEFQSEAGMVASSGPIRLAAGLKWLAAVAAAVLGFSVSIGGFAWYTGALALDRDEMASLIPPSQEVPLQQSSVAPPADAQPFSPQPMQAASAAPASTAPTAERGLYSILVASFESRARAERLVEELTDAGYGARAVERDGGPGRGRLVQVKVTGYTSTAAVQRDLHRIRELPGGYTDARIIEQ
jgi:general secretion pathway protein A